MLTIAEIKRRFGAEMALFILICRVYFKNAGKSDLAAFINENDLDWKLVYKLLRAHQLRPFIYKIVSANSELFESAFTQRLQNSTWKVSIENLDRVKELISLTKDLEQEGITAIPYKGVMLSKRFYNDFITRETCDIDFLIKKEDFNRVRAFFIDRGYQSDYYYNPDYEDVLLDTSVEYVFYKIIGQVLIKVELHWDVIHKMQDVRFNSRELFAATERHGILKNNLQVLNLNNELLVLLIHHGINDIWRSLRHVIDLAMFVEIYEHDINWTGLRQKLINSRIERASLIGFSLSNRIFGVGIPGALGEMEDDAVDQVLRNLLTFPMITRQKLEWANFKQQLQLRDSLSDKLILVNKYLSNAIHPNIRDVASNPLPRRLYFLYYLLKPFRMLNR